MSNHQGTPARRFVRAAFACAQVLIAVTVHLAVDGGPIEVVMSAAAVAAAAAVFTFAGGIHLDVIRPRLLARPHHSAGARR